MPMKAECMSFVCRMVKVFFPTVAAANPPDRKIVAPTVAAPAKSSR
jgi:hypothetical protein